MEIDSFLLVIRSADDSEGGNSRFTFNPSTPLQLQGRWKVALTDFYSPWIKDITDRRKITFKIRPQSNTIKGPHTKEWSYELGFDEMEGTNLVLYLLRENEELKQFLSYSTNSMYSEYLEYAPKVIDNVIYVLDINHEQIVKALGFNPAKWSEINGGFTDNTSLRADTPPQNWINDANVLVKTNILPEQHANLAMLRAPKGSGGIYTKISCPIYLRLKSNIISNIDVLLSSTSDVPFEQMKGESVLVLHFRKE